MIDFDDDEILSMGQSYFDNPENCMESIFLMGPNKRSPEGTLFRLLALYHVKNNYLGIETPWPGVD